MNLKKLKYQEFIDLYPNCPPNTYKEVTITAFRWAFTECDADSFKPVLVINPKRQLNSDDLKCMGYALSMFETEKGAFERYKKLVHARPILKETYGTVIAELNISINDGLASVLRQDKYTHFSFHEYEGVDLSEKIINIAQIFEENGDFKD
jgi:hypothetical protein